MRESSYAPAISNLSGGKTELSPRLKKKTLSQDPAEHHFPLPLPKAGLLVRSSDRSKAISKPITGGSGASYSLPRARLSLSKITSQDEDDRLSNLSVVSLWPDLEATVSFRDMGFELDPFFTRETPDGAILRGFKDEDVEKARRLRNRRCPEDETEYYSKMRHFTEVQKGRAFVSPNEFYEILRKNALKAEDMERESRIKRAQEMFLMHAMGELKGSFIGWKVRS